MSTKRVRVCVASAALCVAVLAIAPAAASAARQGIDVSRFQGEIDWAKVGETEVQFAFAQASRGSGDDCAVAPRRCGADEFYAANYAGARDARIRVGPYHRAFPGGHGPKGQKRDARAEARVFVKRVGKLRKRDLRPALDVETPFGGLGHHALRRWVGIWLHRVRKKLHARPIVYTNTSSWQATGNTTKFARAGHPLWVANFGVKRPSVPAANWNGQGWSIWQYTSSGKVKGIHGNVDKDRLRAGFSNLGV
jgi:lysozyme